VLLTMIEFPLPLETISPYTTLEPPSDSLFFLKFIGA
jgi:hypothetical protein